MSNANVKAKTAGDKLNDALKKADDAVKELKAMGENAKVAITEDFTALKDAIVDTNIAQKIVEAKEKVASATEAGVVKVKEAGAKVDENVHAKPYYYIGGAALIGLLLGVIIGRKS